MYTVMITGGIGSGKSAVVARMKSHSASVVSLDEISHTLLEDDEDLRNDIVDSFGESILDSDGMIVRACLAEKAFASRAAVDELNAITFPYITAKLSDILVESCCLPCGSSQVKVVEIPLLPEVPQMADLADEVLCIWAPRELRRARLVARGLLPHDIERRMALQPTDEDYRSVSDEVMENSEGPEELARAVEEWWARREASGWSRTKA